jgi:hypothetical protein
MTNTPSITSTNTSTPTPSITATQTPTITSTPTNTGTPTNTPSPTATQSVQYFLDIYTGATQAYSVRKLRSGYTGAAFRVRRSSDNAELDIGFVGENMDTATLLTFCGAGDGRIVKIYDQSGNGLDTGTLAAVDQSYVVSAGSLLTSGGKPVYFMFTRPPYSIVGSPNANTFLTVGYLNSFNSINYVLWSPAQNKGLFYGGTFGGVVGQGGYDGANVRSVAPESLIARNCNFYITGTTLHTTFNNSAITPVPGSFTGPIAPTQLFGRLDLTTTRMSGVAQEAIMYSNSRHLDNTAMALNIRTYYSLP